MISLANVTRYHGTSGAPELVLDNVSFRMETRETVGILAASGSGKTTLAQIIAGLERPDLIEQSQPESTQS